MRRSLEGRGWKSPTPRRQRRRRPPSSLGPPPILWSSSARTDRPLAALPVPAVPPLVAPCTASPPGAAAPFRCRLQRNDPGWLVGEQRHVVGFLLPPAVDLGALTAGEELEQGAEAMVLGILVGVAGVRGGRFYMRRDTRAGGAEVRVRARLQRLSRRGCLALACWVRACPCQTGSKHFVSFGVMGCPSPAHSCAIGRDSERLPFV